MKIFAIRDEKMKIQIDLAYLLYYEQKKVFYIEIPEDSNIWELPLLLDSFAKRGENTINSYWSKIWVQQRIVPAERQNIAHILRDNNLEQYDEYELLMIAMGRCAQDDYYLVATDQQSLSKEMIDRFSKRLEDVLILEDNSLLVFFRDGAVKKCKLEKYFSENNKFKILLKNPEYFEHVQLQTGGYGVAWDINMTISYTELYQMGETIPLSANDFHKYVTDCTMNSAEAMKILGCSKQNIADLTKRGKLHPIKTAEKSTLYLKSEILKRNWK